jgi:hypothetical protein
MLISIESPRMLAPKGAPRGEGVHVSSVIRNIATLNKILKPEYAESLDLVDRSSEAWWDSLDPATQTRMSMGLAWEHYYINTQLPEAVHQPGEMCVDGIYMNHDGESLETFIAETRSVYEMVLHEVKLTYKSWNTVRNIQTQWMWLAQMKAYCKALGTLHAWLHVLCVCGDYSYPMSPIVRVFKLQFSKEEITENWDIITTFVRHAQQQQAEDAMRDTYEAM